MNKAPDVVPTDMNSLSDETSHHADARGGTGFTACDWPTCNAKERKLNSLLFLPDAEGACAASFLVQRFVGQRFQL